MKHLNTRVAFAVLLAIFAVSSCPGQERRSNNENLSYFNQPLFPISMNGKWGYIDRSGRVVIKPQFDSARFFREGRARINEWGEGPNGFPMGASGGKKTSGYIDKTGRIVISLPANYRKYDFYEGLATVCRQVRDSVWKCGFIDVSGRTVIGFQFDEAEAFSQGLAAVRVGEQWGYINKFGRYVIQPRFTGFADGFREGLAAVRDKEFNGFIDRSGRLVSKLQISELSGYSEGLAAVLIRRDAQDPHPEWVYIDEKENIILRLGKVPQIKYAFPFSAGMAAVFTEDKMGYIDKSGKFVISPRFEDVDRPLGPREEFQMPRSFGLPFSFSDGLAAVFMGKKWGVIDKTGRFISNDRFDHAWPVYNGMVAISINGKQGYVDKTGDYIWNPTK